MVNRVIKYLTRNEYASAQKKVSGLPADSDIGPLAAQFEPFEPNAVYAKNKLPGVATDFPMITPMNPGKIAPIEPTFRAIIDSLWKRAEPTAGAGRGPVTMGGRGQNVTPQRDAYKPQVVAIKATKATSQEIDDWSYMDALQRTDAITFRGDTRPPSVVIARDGGFFPPATRTDDYYIYNTVFELFRDYMDRRFGQKIEKVDYIRALNTIAPSPQSKSIMLDYVMWRKVVQGESFHLGRMVVEEALKGYISTSRSVSTAAYFGTGRATKDGWIYVTRVRGGFVVPPSGGKWGTSEQEIAQWGPIPAADIVAFRRLQTTKVVNGVMHHSGGVGPIWFRPGFRKSEHQAFVAAWDLLSHRNPATTA